MGTDDPRVRKFVNEVGPKISDYIGQDPACIISIPTGGIFYGMALRTYLLRLHDDVNYAELPKDGGRLYKHQVGGRKVVLVDDAISTGRTYRGIKGRVDAVKDDLEILDVKYAVEHDIAGLADFACENNSPKEAARAREGSELFDQS